jgi:hypothetical protein
MPFAGWDGLIADCACYILNQHEAIALDYVTFVASEKVIVCTLCRIAIPVAGLDTHLRTYHHVPSKLRRMTIARFDSVPAAQTFKDLVPRQDGSTPLSYLSPPAPGFCCPHCTQGQTINWDQMRRHAKAEHNISAPECVQDQSRYECYLQSWTKYSPKYWVVTQDNSASKQGIQEQPHSTISTHVRHRMLSVHLRAYH